MCGFASSSQVIGFKPAIDVIYGELTILRVLTRTTTAPPTRQWLFSRASVATAQGDFAFSLTLDSCGSFTGREGNALPL